MGSCVYIPKKGKDLFLKLKKNFGYQDAVNLYYTAFNPNFKQDFKDSLSFDEEGVVTYESFINNKYIKRLLGENKILHALQKDFEPVEDSEHNYITEVEKAHTFNLSSPNKEDFVAVVEKQDNGKIQTIIKSKDKSTIDLAANQYAAYKLNNRLSEIFSKIDISVGKLTEIEEKAGRVGVTDFSVAKSLASDFGSIIKVANNMEGASAVSEEFSHLIIGSFINDNLIQRSINLLASKPELLKEILGEDYNDTVDFHNGDMALVAEEALGHLLQEHLINKMGGDAPTIAKRALSKITDSFKDYDVNEVYDAIDSADKLMNSLANGILSGEIAITKQQVIDNSRYVQLNALAKELDRNIEILKKAIDIEIKRSKIQRKGKNETEDLIMDLKKHLGGGVATAYGISEYMKHATESLIKIHKQYDDISRLNQAEKFAVLRTSKENIDSYGRFIGMLNEAIIEEKEQGNAESRLVSPFKVKGEEIDIQSSLVRLKKLYDDLASRYRIHSKSSFTNFLSKFLADGASITLKGQKKEISVEELLTESDDISFFDRWLDSMSDSSDVILQLISKSVADAKTKVRLNTLDDIREIQALMLDAEKEGITSFEWMFEKDSDGKKTGNYISAVNYGQYYRDLKQFSDETDKKYGVNPTGKLAGEKLSAIRNWHKTHSKDGMRCKIPNPISYRNEDYFKLTDKQKSIFDKFIKLKDKYEERLPEKHRNSVRAIQKRRDNVQRFSDANGNISKIFQAVKENLKADFIRMADDNEEYGTTLVDFGGNEYKQLPVLYTNRLENPDELSTDIFGTLISYAYMTNNYVEMDKIIDPLEVGMDVMKERKIIKPGKKEKINFIGYEINNPVYTSHANSLDKYEDFLDMQVYGRYLKDHGEWDLFGLKIDKQKFTSALLKMSAMSQLGFNFTANIVNITNGLHMQLIESTARKYFSEGTLFKADMEYKSAMKGFLSQLGSRVQTNKLALFDELFNVKQNISSQLRYSDQRKNWLKRIFGSNMAFFGQEAGDHWLYNRTAIAMALNKKVLLNNKEMSLWEALKVENVFKDRNDVKQLNIKDIKNLDGTDFDVNDFSEKMKHINQYMFGIYNEEDKAAIHSYAVGRIFMLYRNWLKPSLNKRFMGRQYNSIMDEEEEGYYRTLARFLNELRRGEFQLSACYNQLEDWEKANIRKACTELFQTLIFWGLANWVEWPDDKNRPWAVKYAELIARKNAHDLASLTPSTVMIQEDIKTFSDPSALISTVKNLFDLTKIFTSPIYAQEEIQSGPYRGMTHAEKWLYNAPLPAINEYRRVDKLVDGLDFSVQYYANPNAR